jgi:hypothetical protein
MSKIDELLEKEENWSMVNYRMDAEGFHYCFKYYSDFDEIQDEKFHELRKRYLETANHLETYVEYKLNEIREEINNIDEDE